MHRLFSLFFLSANVIITKGLKYEIALMTVLQVRSIWRNANMIDLHVHSNRSDGTYSPTELVDYAIEKGLKAFALTDHDTTEGLLEALEYAQSLKKAQERGEYDVSVEIPEVIPGIELSTEYHGKDIHIVGLYINYEEPSFQEYLKHFIDSRVERNHKMCKLLQEHGVDVTYETLIETFPNAVITRAHYAKFLLEKGYVGSMNEAFDRYVGDHAPCFVPREKVTPAQAVELILAADGVPILAHPMLYRMSDERLDKLVAQLKEVGLMGIEAIYCTYTQGEERKVRKLAEKYRLLISGGSDFHGSNKPKLDFGVGYGSLHVPDQVLDDINMSRKNLLFTDMDGTLLLNNSTISDKMKDAIAQMTKAGHHLILSSGRPLPSILEVRANEGIEYPNMLIISNNGALVYDCDSKKPILEHRICQKDIRYIVDAAHKAGIHIHGYTLEEIVCLHPNAELDFYTRRIHLPLKCVPDITAALPKGSFKLQCIHLTDRSVLEAFRDSLREYCGDRIQLIFSNDQYLEILPAAAGKGSALKFVTQHLHAPHSHTFASGDAENDLSMIEAAHVGIAMQNASQVVKDAADIVTKLDNDHDGLLEILREHFEVRER